MLTIVANPIGKAPRKRDCCGWKSILRKTEGQSVYRRLGLNRISQARGQHDSLITLTRT